MLHFRNQFLTTNTYFSSTRPNIGSNYFFFIFIKKMVLIISFFKAVLTSFISEPSAAPLNVRGHNTSSTSIFVTWDDVPAADKNGIITSYNITYHSLTENHSNSTTVDYPDRQVTLVGLRKFVNYSITVFASTVKGNGPESDPVIITTGEDSEYFRFWSNVVRCLSEFSFYLLTLSSPVPDLI